MPFRNITRQHDRRRPGSQQLGDFCHDLDSSQSHRQLIIAQNQIRADAVEIYVLQCFVARGRADDAVSLEAEQQTPRRQSEPTNWLTQCPVIICMTRTGWESCSGPFGWDMTASFEERAALRDREIRLFTKSNAHSALCMHRDPDYRIGGSLRRVAHTGFTAPAPASCH